MRTFLTRLLRASQWGATLVVAGCGPAIDTTETTDPPVNEVGEPIGETPAPMCEGPVYADDFGYHGQCCYDVYCTAPVDGVCADPADAKLSGLPPGSGECECGARKGPYANEDPASPYVCCYLVGGISCDGRPLRIDGAPRLAEVSSGPSAWSSAPEGTALTPADVAGIELELRAKLARRWADRARFEHASVASFARFSMALLACGAPPALVAASHQAALDEVRHAQIALSLSSAYAGRPQGFGPLNIEGALSGEMTLEAVALATVIEGCVGETLAAIEVAASAAAAGPGAVREALSAVAEDETRHAELAWAFVQWAAGVGGAALRGRIALAFEQAFEQAAEPVRSDDPAGCAEHGFLSDDEVSRLRRKAIAEVLRPAAAALRKQRSALGSAFPQGGPSCEFS